MAKTYKRPTLAKFSEIMKQTGGNMTNAAELIGCSRQEIWKWAKEDPAYREAIDESRKRLFDKCLSTAQIVAQGVPIIENGNFIGWQIPPDPNMLRFFLSTLGRDEGFGDTVEINHNVKKGIDVSSWIKQEMMQKNKKQE